MTTYPSAARFAPSPDCDACDLHILSRDVYAGQAVCSKELTAVMPRVEWASAASVTVVEAAAKAAVAEATGRMSMLYDVRSRGHPVMT